MKKNIDIESLTRAVQWNCDISDACLAGDYTMCVYLLKMREYYRWRNGISFGAEMPVTDIGNWVQEKETLWAELESEDFIGLDIAGTSYDRFDVDGINLRLNKEGIVYGAGYGRFLKPYFFVGDLLQRESLPSYTVLICGQEYARELAAPPAMVQGNTIFVRRECLRRMLWEMVEEQRWQKQDNAITRAIGCYDFDADPSGSLEDMTVNELESIILHEIGEVVAGNLIGEVWNEMLADISRSASETMVRAVRDLLADCLSTLPAMLEERNEASIHFYFANMSPTSSNMFPTLKCAYQKWIEQDDIKPLKNTVRDGWKHWLAVAREIVDVYLSDREHGADEIESVVTGSRF